MGFRPQQAPPSPGLERREPALSARWTLQPPAQAPRGCPVPAHPEHLPCSCPPSYSLTSHRRGKGLGVRGSSGRSKAEKPGSKAPRVLGLRSGSSVASGCAGSSAASPASQGQQVSVRAPLPRCPSTLGLAEDPCRLALSPDFSGFFPSSCRCHPRLGTQICWTSLLGWTWPGCGSGPRRLPRHLPGSAVGEGAQTHSRLALIERTDTKEPNCFFQVKRNAVLTLRPRAVEEPNSRSSLCLKVSPELTASEIPRPGARLRLPLGSPNDPQ